jgi:hypothetical protein
MSDMFGHHTCEGNLEKCFYNILLLQDHYSGANVNCSNCIIKHISDVIAYCEEGISLDNGYKYVKLVDKITELMNVHLKIVLECVVDGKCKVKNPHDMHKMIQEARSMRREIGQVLYGVDTDVASDEEDHGFTRKGDSHTESHHHEHKADEHELA